MIRILLVALLLIPMPVLAQSSSEDRLMAAYREKTQVVRPCRYNPGEIVVCGSHAERNAKERLPLPEERESTETGIVRGEAPRASAARVRSGACGVEGGQGAGCVGGLSILQGIKVIGKLAGKIIDPDHEGEPEPLIPDRFRGATPP